MKQIFVILPILCAAALCAPCTAEAQNSAEGDFFRQEGIASWYGTEFDGKPTASGEIFNSSLLTAAHPNLPFGTVLTVTNTYNNRRVTVKVNDRGPFVSARIIDISKAAAEELDMLITGTAPVLIESIQRLAPYSQASPRVGAESLWSPPPAPPAPPPAVAPAPPPPAVTPTPPATRQPAPPPPAPRPEPPAPRPEPRPAPAPIRYSAATLIPPIEPVPDKLYRLQLGAYSVPRNAVEALERLKNAGLNPAYERLGDLYRVVLPGIRGSELPYIAEKLGTAGFREALIREEP